MTNAVRSSGRTSEFVVLDSGCYFGAESAREMAKRSDCTVLDIYRLGDYDLSPHGCLVIDGFADQEFLYEERERIRHFLDQGKVLIFSGHLFRPWLPGGSLFVPKPIHSFHDYMVSIEQPHPIFDGVLPQEMTYYKGVAGFFARGHHPLPPNAEVLLTLPDGEPITYIDRHSTRGTILVHAGNNLFAYGSNNSSIGRIGDQLRRWILEEFRHIAEREASS